MRIGGRSRPLARGVTPIIASVLLTGITVAAGAVVWGLSIKPPPDPTNLEYFSVVNSAEPQWGDGSDCKNVNGVQSCLTLPAIDIVITGSTPSFIPLSGLTFYFLCNGTIYLQSSFDDMKWVPGYSGTPSPNAPALQHCGTYTPPRAAFNRLVFFEQLNPNSTGLSVGDMIVLTSHTFTTFNDDDFHGAPQWCFSVQGACNIVITYNGPPSSTLLTIPLSNFASN